jgi:nitrogen fixation/metabolism regulation signal transduction histidine kinase
MYRGKTIFKRFRINLLLRLLIIIINGTALLWITINTTLWMLTFWLALFEIVLVIELVRFIEKFKSSILVFLESINQEDYSIVFPKENLKNPDGRFANLFNSILKKLQLLRAEKETRQIYLQTVIEQATVGIIGYNSSHEITIINEAAKNLLNRPFIRNLSGIKTVSKSLYEAIVNIDAQEGILIKYDNNRKLMQVLLKATELRTNGEYLKIITLQDIKNELDEKELESWQKLIRIINHEVMNSMIPLSTLTNVNKKVLQEVKDGSGKFKDERISDVIEGMEIIENRSQGIMEFVKSVKSLTNISKPNFVKIKINDLLNRVYSLMDSEFQATDIHFELLLPEDNFILIGDLELIEQALINLINNAKEALVDYHTTNSKNIILSAEKVDGFSKISVTDNGPGISKKSQEDIFIPFFTTKKNGSGVGLSLSRQIMRLHKGQLILSSEEGNGSAFILRF